MCIPAITPFSVALCSGPSMLFAALRPRVSARPSGMDSACAQRTILGAYVMAGDVVC
jgi:hypothetical protein